MHGDPGYVLEAGQTLLLDPARVLYAVGGSLVILDGGNKH